jgi:hypothetical protein
VERAAGAPVVVPAEEAGSGVEARAAAAVRAVAVEADPAAEGAVRRRPSLSPA